MPLKICLFNAQSLKSKFAHFSSFITEHEPDIVVVTETWFDNDIQDSEYTPDGYVSFRRDRNIDFYSPGTYKVSDRGGVLILVKDILHPTRYTDADVEAEILWISINPHPTTSWLIGGCYRPEVDEEHILEKICQSINKVDTGNCILLGDFNFRNIVWTSMSGSRTLEEYFIDTISDNLLTQIVTEPTRLNNILDLAFVSDVSTVLDCSVSEGFSKSDHNIVWLTVNCPVPRIAYQPRKIYLYSQGNYSAINQKLLEYNWKENLSHRNIENNWQFFLRSYESLVDEFIPSKFIKPGQRHRPPWTRYRSVKHARHYKRKQFIRSRESGLHADRMLYEESTEHLESVVKEAKRHYEDKLVDRIGQNPKLFWNYTRHFSRSSSTVDMLVDGANKVTEDSDKAELLNSYFTSVLTHEPEITITLPQNPNPHSILLDFEIMPITVRDKLTKLKLNKACGPDEVSVNVLKKSINYSEKKYKKKYKFEAT